MDPSWAAAHEVLPEDAGVCELLSFKPLKTLRRSPAAEAPFVPPIWDVRSLL